MCIYLLILFLFCFFDEQQLIRSAEDIYETHLKSSAAMPVNVESSAIREVEEKLKRPTNELFATVQYQVSLLNIVEGVRREVEWCLGRRGNGMDENCKSDGVGNEMEKKG